MLQGVGCGRNASKSEGQKSLHPKIAAARSREQECYEQDEAAAEAKANAERLAAEAVEAADQAIAAVPEADAADEAGFIFRIVSIAK